MISFQDSGTKKTEIESQTRYNNTVKKRRPSLHEPLTMWKSSASSEGAMTTMCGRVALYKENEKLLKLQGRAVSLRERWKQTGISWQSETKTRQTCNKTNVRSRLRCSWVIIKAGD